MRRDPWRDSCPDFPDLMSRLSRLKLSARLGNLSLNPDAARPLARLMSRFSRPYVQTFQTQTLGATMQFESKSRCGATLGATHVQIFQTLCPDFPDSNSRRDYAIWVDTPCKKEKTYLPEKQNISTLQNFKKCHLPVIELRLT